MHTDGTMDTADVRHGLYILHWYDGGSSLAAVGYDACGKWWFAPVNWITVPCFDWSYVSRIEPVLTETDYRLREPATSPAPERQLDV